VTKYLAEFLEDRVATGTTFHRDDQLIITGALIGVVLFRPPPYIAISFSMSRNWEG
jgi:hypothetical protein